MNKPTPMFNPLCTAKVWLPIYVPSAIMSLNHNDIDSTKDVILRNKLFSAKANP
jgi:hypothetical protein